MSNEKEKIPRGTASTAAILLLIAAVAVTALAGTPGISEAKVTGAVLALAAFVPVFLMLLKAMGKGTPNEVLGTFVGGFFFKLLVLGMGVWWGVKKAGFPIIDFSTACLSFLVAFQIIESLYFAGRGK